MSQTVIVQSKAVPEGETHWRSALAARLPSRGWRTRFAPAPTGYLHLGHLVNAIFVWGIARAHGGTVTLRIEDHDATRCRAEFDAGIVEDLRWLGFQPDDISESESSGDAPVVMRQSARGAIYQRALDTLAAQSMVYACVCTRKDIERLAPHVAGEEARYPGTCRDLHLDEASTHARRVIMTTGAESFDDMRLGAMAHEPAQQCGDVLVRDRLGQWTYQFAASVDDLMTDITVVIRGEDLLTSTARQMRLARLLGRREAVRVLHHPLLVHPDGAKLSKANHDTAIRERRSRGERAEQLIGEAAWLAGLTSSPRALAANDVATLFR